MEYSLEVKGSQVKLKAKPKPRKTSVVGRNFWSLFTPVGLRTPLPALSILLPSDHRSYVLAGSSGLDLLKQKGLYLRRVWRSDMIKKKECSRLTPTGFIAHPVKTKDLKHFRRFTQMKTHFLIALPFRL